MVFILLPMVICFTEGHMQLFRNNVQTVSTVGEITVIDS